jgi:hypothetical protein
LTGVNIDEYFTRTDTTTSTFLNDALGSAVGLVGSGGTIATNYIYQPFGAPTVGGSVNGNSHEFTGRDNDGTGLYFYRARYYSPTQPVQLWHLLARLKASRRCTATNLSVIQPLTGRAAATLTSTLAAKLMRLDYISIEHAITARGFSDSSRRTRLAWREATLIYMLMSQTILSAIPIRSDCSTL